MKRLILILLVLGCSSCAYAFYRGYGLDVENVDVDKGFLRRKNPKEDLPLSICKPTVENKSPCVVVKSETWFRMKRDFEELQRKCGDN